MTGKVTFPKLLLDHAKAHRPKPVFADDNLPELKNADDCPNCGGRGFIAAFFAAYPKSEIVGHIPTVTKGEAMSFINGAWWVGNTRTYPCPLCRRQIAYHDGRGNGR